MSVFRQAWHDWGKRFSALRACIPGWLYGYLWAYLAALFLFVFWVPGNDFDSMSSYIARIKLEEFGPLRETATLELQYVFPKFFDYLHKPFLILGYFTTFPSFALFCTVILLLVRLLPASQAIVALAFLFLSETVLAGATSQKDDLSLACFALFTWYAVFYLSRTRYYLIWGLLGLCALVGTKWSGFFLVLPLGGLFAWRLCTDSRPGPRAILAAFLMLPVFWWVSSAGVYLTNYQEFKTPFPHFGYLNDITSHGVVHSLLAFVLTTVVQTVEVPLYYANEWLSGRLWPTINELTLGAMDWAWGLHLMTNSHIAPFGISFLLLLVMGTRVMLRKSTPFALRASVAVALFYFACFFLCFEYMARLNRYLLPTYLLLLVPVAQEWRFKSPAWRPLAIIAVLWATLHTLLFNQEHRLLHLYVYNARGGYTYSLESIFDQKLTHDLLYFQVWSGYEEIYAYMQAHIRSDDSLLFINKAEGDRVPFIYPLIMDRLPENTAVYSTRNGIMGAQVLERPYRFIAVFYGTLAKPEYRQIYQYGDELRLYERM